MKTTKVSNKSSRYWVISIMTLIPTIGCSESSELVASTQTWEDIAQYFIAPDICQDTEGPDCTKLRLGDSHLTTIAPERGKLFACKS